MAGSECVVLRSERGNSKSNDMYSDSRAMRCEMQNNANKMVEKRRRRRCGRSGETYGTRID